MTEQKAIEWLCNSCGSYVCDKKGTCEMLQKFLNMGIENNYIFDKDIPPPPLPRHPER